MLKNIQNCYICSSDLHASSIQGIPRDQSLIGKERDGIEVANSDANKGICSNCDWAVEETNNSSCTSLLEVIVVEGELGVGVGVIHRNTAC